MARGNRTSFTPQNPEKYNGTYPIISRSSWELEFMKYCDMHPDVLEWSSEPVKIPYANPTKDNKSQSLYIPDFLVTFLTKDKQTVTKLIEIKPLHEADQGYARNTMDSVMKMKNDAKWGAAQAWAMRRGIEFLVMTEAELFSGHANRKPRQNPVRNAVPGQVKKLQARAPNKKKSKLAAGYNRKTNRASGVSGLNKVKSSKIRKAAKSPKVRKR